MYNCNISYSVIYSVHWIRFRFWMFSKWFVIIFFSATTATALEHLGTSITSDFDGTPPLYITKTRKNNQEYIYVNNALILHSRSNIQMVNEAGKKQVNKARKCATSNGSYSFVESGKKYGKTVIQLEITQ